jgi:hypothetical protein
MDKRISDLEVIKQVFGKYGVRFLVVYGACLGFYRDKNFLPDDDDIDLAVIEPVDFKTRKAIGWSLYDLGFKTQPIAFNVFGRMEISEQGYNGDENSGIIVCEKNIKFTIFFFNKPEECKQHVEEIVCVPKLGSMKLISSPAKFYRKLGELKIGGKKYLCPSPIEEYLAFTYFNNWKDKTDRRHGHTYYEMHGIEKLEDISKNNAATIWKNK